MNDFVMIAVKPDIKQLAKEAAVKKGQFTYQWIAEAIKEKAEKEANDGKANA